MPVCRTTLLTFVAQARRKVLTSSGNSLPLPTLRCWELSSSTAVAMFMFTFLRESASSRYRLSRALLLRSFSENIAIIGSESELCPRIETSRVCTREEPRFANHLPVNVTLGCCGIDRIGGISLREAISCPALVSTVIVNNVSFLMLWCISRYESAFIQRSSAMHSFGGPDLWMGK